MKSLLVVKVQTPRPLRMVLSMVTFLTNNINTSPVICKQPYSSQDVKKTKMMTIIKVMQPLRMAF